jgi:hypothetical protein
VTSPEKRAAWKAQFLKSQPSPAVPAQTKAEVTSGRKNVANVNNEMTKARRNDKGSDLEISAGLILNAGFRNPRLQFNSRPCLRCSREKSKKARPDFAVNSTVPRAINVHILF